MPPRFHADFHVDERFQGLVAPETLVRVAELALRRERLSGPTRASITITDDEALQRLNREFRGEDKVTDVLSFGASPNARDGKVDPSDFPTGPGEVATLGDVIISYPQAERQAAAAGHPVGRELALLTIHGVLHLLGFDHADIDEERVMFKKQDAILEQVLGTTSARDRS
ncbi:MAG: rRNA maturation RNase YbeY [Chloroflexi bacterium]|nr:rRNA maturation RNase YbeY [Chloroflexota bacterium]